MKVLHVIDSLGVGGGAEHSLAGMLPLLRDRGVESSIACLIPRQGGLQRRLGEEGFPVEVLDGATLAHQARSLRRRILSEEPDLVHSTLYSSCLVTRLAAARLRCARLDSLVNTSYDPVRTSQLDIAPWKLRLARAVDSFTARRSRGHFHAVTSAVQTEAVNVLGVDAERITVVPRGRSSSALGTRSAERRRRVRAELGIDDHVPVVLNVGRQDSQKAQDVLIRAFALACQRHPRAVLLIAGREGDATAGVRRALDESGVGSSVRLLGHRTDVPDLLVACDVFAFPSMYEGAAGSILEAMALGAPVVGSDSSAVSEVLGHGEFGVITRRGDVDGLGAELGDLLADPARRASLAARARHHFEEQYEIERVADQVLALYTTLVEEAELGS